MFILRTVLVSALLQTSQQAPVQVALLRAAVGPSGQVRNGDYVLDEERSRFDPATDKQVVVLFQWQGAPGLHRMAVQWKSPDGASSTTPPVEYAAPDRRFGGYWPLTLSSTTATGTWAVDAIVDGQPAGHLTFEVGSSGGAAIPKPTRRILTQSQLFDRLNAVFVTLERSTAKGRHLDPAAGVLVGHGRIVTSMAAVDGADALTAVLPDGKRQPLNSIVAMDRMHDWVVFAGGPDGDIGQPVAAEGTVQIGDRCYSLEASSGAGRIALDCAITGRAGSAGTGARFIAMLGGNSGVPGSPVFSEFGEIVGFIGGALVSGISDLSDLLYFRADLKGTPIVPIATVNLSSSAPPVAFADAWSRGDILHALEGRENIISGGFAKGILKDQTVRPADQRQDFSPRDKEFVVFITWGPQARVKGMTTLHLYDEHNVSVGESKPSKIDVRPGASVLTSWKLPVPSKAGTYRAEVLVDATPVWRGFVKVTD